MKIIQNYEIDLNFFKAGNKGNWNDEIGWKIKI